MTRNKAILGTIILLVLAPLIYLGVSPKGKIILVRLLATESTLREYSLPERTQWRPIGAKKISLNENVNARQVTFGRSLHTDTHGSDEIATVIAPAVAVDWTVETNFFIAEGPVFDKEGNIYFSPIFPPEDVIMVSLEPSKGERRWVVEGFSAGAGTPLILIDPETGDDIIYIGTYDRAMALKTDGTVIWDVSTGLALIDPQNPQPSQHSYGINYHIQSDALIAAMADGHVYVLDRKTGRQLLTEPFIMPGAKTKLTNFSLPEDIAEKANRDIAHMVGAPDANQDPVNAVLHAAAGELQKVSNFFSIDSNSGRIWIAATLPDEEDGNPDGWSDFAALYGLDLVAEGPNYRLDIQVVSQVPGGTASTPAISPDGKRIYVADAFGSIYAINSANGEKFWSFDVGSKVTGSLSVAADNGEVFANTRTDIKKIIDHGDHAELAWVANMNMYKTGRFQKNFKDLGAEIGANGIAFAGAVGIVAGKQRFAAKLGVGLIDRESGEVTYFTEGAEDSVSSMVTGPDGGMYIGNSPLRRVIGRAVLGKAHSPQAVVGGITKFKPIHQNLMIRDALWAAANRAENAATIVNSHPRVVKQDIFQIGQLLDQCRRTPASAIREGSLSQGNWVLIENTIAQAEENLTVDAEALSNASKLLE
ncbi:MAG: PQQ-binding-like beta-propeller repeat protein, partial [Proteobacteria bacterium]|nr:PQQ-binding-like beta-propeller repeat protein [Pseudomonadota bacterium]